MGARVAAARTQRPEEALPAANGDGDEASKKQLHASFRFVGLAPAQTGVCALIVKDDQSGAPLLRVRLPRMAWMAEVCRDLAAEMLMSQGRCTGSVLSPIVPC